MANNSSTVLNGVQLTAGTGAGSAVARAATLALVAAVAVASVAGLAEGPSLAILFALTRSQAGLVCVQMVVAVLAVGMAAAGTAMLGSAATVAAVPLPVAEGAAVDLARFSNSFGDASLSAHGCKAQEGARAAA